jgi:DNA-binding transcriptional regulator/RsmH inhibitor MraZ
VEGADNIPEIEPPRGMYKSRLDERARLKLPADFHNYVKTQEKKLFVTSLDRKTIRVYFLKAWRQNEAFFATHREKKQALKNVAFTANELGAECETDNQGRIPLSAELRDELNIQPNQEVRLYYNAGRIEVLSEAEYRAQRDKAAASTEQDLLEMEGAGLL